MPDRHPHWPAGVPERLPPGPSHLYEHVEAAAERFPDKPFVIYYDTPLTFAAFKEEVDRLAGFLQCECGVRQGDRVLLCMQNSPQWMVAFYAVLRANAIVVPTNPMYRASELRHLVQDSGVCTAIVAQEVLDEFIGEGPDNGVPDVSRLIVAAYGDYVRQPTLLKLPDVVAAPRRAVSHPRVTPWSEALARSLRPGALSTGRDDLCVIPYTSGSTGRPKGCMHTHRTVSATVVGGMLWFWHGSEDVFLSVLPFFHVTGLTGALCGPMSVGATVVLMSRWDPPTAAQCIERYRVTSWQVISTMLVDFVALLDRTRVDVSSLRVLRGGGASMPSALGARLKALTGLDYVEGYGMSETIAATHINPPGRPKRQCLGIPVFDVDARVVDPDTGDERPMGEVGELVVCGPQVMSGYWNDPQATQDAFLHRDGKPFLRTGDLVRVDEDGYYFMVDRLKRMINASGFKVWPAEVEAALYRHPAVQEACVVAARDPRRGETVKAVVVLKSDEQGKVNESDIVEWARSQMAAYKSPRVVEFVDHLPKSSSGKVLWRALQERELA